ncbi:hypothetical protein ACFE04_029979 [Oxalis oulophora]
MRFCPGEAFTHDMISLSICLVLQGFRKIDPDQWEFANENFISGHRHLLKEIYRRKPIHSHSQLSATPLSETERQEYQDKIKRLSHEKLQLQTEMQSLHQRLQHMEDRLKTFLATPLPPASFDHIHNKKRRILLMDHFNDEALFKMEEELEQYEDNYTVEQIEEEEEAAALKTSISQENMIQLYSPQSRDVVSSPDFKLAVIDSRPQSPHLNNSIKTTDEHALKLVDKVKNTSQVNDVFWSHFLSENYTLHGTEEERCKIKNSCNSYDHVDNLTKHLRHLTPAE